MYIHVDETSMQGPVRGPYAPKVPTWPPAGPYPRALCTLVHFWAGTLRP